MSARFFAHAKINLLLRVFAPDASGFHPIETLFCALELADEIALDFDVTGIEIETMGADLGPPTRNLAYRAADEFFRTTGLPPRAGIRLSKHIPAAGGLGGGSSDAATVLLALNRHYGDVLADADLLAIAARIGSDVAFFVCRSSYAHATGYGEILRPLPALPRAPVLLIVPGTAISTADAYRWLDETRAYSSAAAEPTLPCAWHEVERAAANAFEPVVFARHPQLARLPATLAQAGAHIALLSGSGSCVFGVFASEAAAAAAAAHMRATIPNAAVVSTATLT